MKASAWLRATKQNTLDEGTGLTPEPLHHGPVIDATLVDAMYPHAVPVLLFANRCGLDWFDIDRECFSESLRARNSAEFEFAIDNFHYAIRNHFWKRWLRIRLSGRRLARLQRHVARSTI